MLRAYFFLTKPGIVYGNAIAASAGFFIASTQHIDPLVYLQMLVGISSIVASACVFNNYIDRDIDAKMERTKDRALVNGTISLRSALIYGAFLLIFGGSILFLTNALTAYVALFGVFMYVVVYSLWCKRNTLHATVIGAVSGAVPPVVGYTSVTNTLDLGALILFFILFTWQMPHALAIAIRRYDDYLAAKIPVMPISIGIGAAKAQMLSYVFAFFVSIIALSIAGYVGKIFMIGMISLSAIWLILCVQGYWEQDQSAWAKRVFMFSLMLLLALLLLSLVEIFV
jgi:protoheme IX farnesyltransferase